MIETGTLINDRYELLEKIGRGGFGEVWKAHESGLDNTVALKFLAKNSPEAEAAFLQEARLICKLAASTHPGAHHILDIRNYHPRNGDIPAFLELEYMPNGSLATFIEINHQMRGDQLKKLIRDLAQAIQCAHAADVIHCDIKPQNILLSGQDDYKLSDFGLARKMGRATSNHWGTPAYMSPEQFESPKQTSWASDVYSLGAVLYECAEGRKLYKADSREDYARKHLEGRPPSFTNHSIRNELREIIADCLNKNPENRPGLDEILARIEDSDSDVVAPVKRIPQLILKASSKVEHPDSKMLFVDTGLGFYAPESPVTNRMFEKFLISDDGRRFRQGILDPKLHDGGYLPDWAFGKPLPQLVNRLVSGMPFEVAEAYCRWSGGRLPAFEELQKLSETEAGLAILKKIRDHAAASVMAYMQCWCTSSNAQLGNDEGLMWILWKVENPYSDIVRSVTRKRFFCFPHYFILPIIDSDVAQSAAYARRTEKTEHTLYTATASKSVESL